MMASIALKARQLLINMFFKYLLIVGYLSDQYDISKHRIYHCKMRRAYAFVVNVFLIFSLPYAFFATHQLREYRQKRHELLRQTEMATALIYFVAVTLAIATRIHREYCFREVMRAFYVVEEEYFEKLPFYADIERRYGVVFIVKMFTTMSQLPISVYLHMLNQSVDTRTLLLSLYFSNVGYILHGIVFHHFLSLWYVSRNYERLNRELLKAWDKLRLLQEHGTGLFNARSDMWRQLTRLTTEEVRLTADVHWSLTVMMERINNTFTTLVTAVLITYILKNITAGYYAVLAYEGLFHMEGNCSATVFSGMICIILIADLYIFYMMCEWVTRNFEATADVLHKFSLLAISDSALEQQCEAFTLQLTQHKLSVNLAGLFTLNMQTFLALWSFIIRHTIILVQSDYEDRYRRARAHND